jgi:hypothetical protein
MTEPMDNYDDIEAERTEVMREENADLSQTHASAEDGLSFAVDGRADLTKAVNRNSIIGSSQQKFEKSVN